MTNGADGEVFGLTAEEVVNLRRLWEMRPGERTAKKEKRREGLRLRQISEAVKAKVQVKLLGLFPEKKREPEEEEPPEKELREIGEERCRYLRRNLYEILILAAPPAPKPVEGEGRDYWEVKRRKRELPEAIVERLCLDSKARHVSKETIHTILLRFRCRGDLLEALRYAIGSKEILKDHFGKLRDVAAREDLDSLEKMVKFLRKIKNIA